jgi:hypothetical protein
MGIHKYIETPEIMWQHFEAYRRSVKEKPIKKMVFVGKDGNRDDEERERPLTMDGFQNWLDDNEIITDVTDYFENKEKRYNDFVRICSRIKRNIRQDQIEGGMAGIYNASITQRLNNLKESIQEEGTKDVTIKVRYERKDNNPEPSA